MNKDVKTDENKIKNVIIFNVVLLSTHIYILNE